MYYSSNLVYDASNITGWLAAAAALMPSSVHSRHLTEMLYVCYVKDGAIVYAELDLKSSDESSCLRGKEETTEYAEIVPVNTDDAPPTKTSDDTEDDQTPA